MWNMYPFMLSVERGNANNVSKTGKERQKDTKGRHVLSAVCAESDYKFRLIKFTMAQVLIN